MDPTIIYIGIKTDRAHERGHIDMLAKLRTITRNDEGASAVEYGLLVAAVAAVIVVIVFAFGNVIQEVFQGTCEEVAEGAATNPVAIEADCEPPAGGVGG